MSALNQLVEMSKHPDPFRTAPDNLRELQLKAIGERFAERRPQVKVLDHRAREGGIDRIGSLSEVVPLLIADSTFKSYPETFLEKKRWDRMTMWLQTISTQPITGMRHSEINSADEWIAELHRNGHYVVTSSGTSGKQSFIDQTEGDARVATDVAWRNMQWAFPSLREEGNRRYPLFMTFPSGGAHVASFRSERFAAMVAIPGDVHYLSTVGQSADAMLETVRLRKAIGEGTATPGEIADYEARNAARQKQISSDVENFIALLLERRKDQMLINGSLPMLYAVVKEGRRRGIADGEFHKLTIVSTGGGRKGAALPEDFEEQIYAFFGFGRENIIESYGFSEISNAMPSTKTSGGYVMAPWLVPIILDKSGEKLLNPESGRGEIEGRMAVVDLLVEGRWGGIITGDKVVVDFAPKQDGLKVPVVKSITRYKDLPEGDDKLTCAGTVDAYVRGLVDA